MSAVSSRTLVAARLRPYAVAGIAGLVAALLLGRPEPAAAAGPLLVFAVVALAGRPRPGLTIDLRLDRDRAFEGEEVAGVLVLTATESLERLDLALGAGRGRTAVLAASSVAVVAWVAQEVPFRLRCERWGGGGRLRVEAGAPGALGAVRHHWHFDLDRPLRVYPAPDRLRGLTLAYRTGALAGDRVARLAGEGIEFAGVRPHEAGDGAARVNWRVTARRGALHVNRMHPERNADVVVFLDTFADIRGSGSSTLETAVRGAAALVELHLRGRDRVGLVGFGGTLRWLRPAQGGRQLYRVLDSLIDTDVVMSYAWKGVEVIPRRTIPPGSLVLALSPLLDERTVGAIADLRLRGHDVAVLEVAPEGLLPPPVREVEAMARRLWLTERGAVRDRLLELGIAVGRWAPGDRLEVPLAEVAGFRRRSRGAIA